MREFLLQNQYGEKRLLQYGDVFLWLPSGLGYGYINEYMETGSFFIPTYVENEHIPIDATLVFFPPNAYAKYQTLFNWILGSESLELAYKPINDWYYQQVSIGRVDKTELTKQGTLEVPVQIMPLSPIYNPAVIEKNVEGQITDSIKKYDYQYDYRYSNSGIAGVITYTADAQMPCDIEVEINGAISAPSITVTRDDTNEIIGIVDLSAISAQAGEKIVYNTVAGRAGVTLTDGNGDTTDMSQYLGLGTGYPTFFHIPPNVPCTYQIKATSLVGLSARLQIYRYYRTV